MFTQQLSLQTFSFALAASPGAALGLLEVADNKTSTFGTSVAVKHRFVCMSHAPTALAVYSASDPIRQNSHAICVDGLNVAGLSMAVLYQVRPPGGAAALPWQGQLQQALLPIDWGTALPGNALPQCCSGPGDRPKRRAALHVVHAVMHLQDGRDVQPQAAGALHAAKLPSSATM